MPGFLVVFFFIPTLTSHRNILVATNDMHSIQNDLAKFGLSCPNDNCQFSQEDSLESQACHCGIHCVQLGTCCFDSPYAGIPQPKPKPVCRPLSNKMSYFIVRKCLYTDSVWASQCNDESSGDDDLQKLVPVTSVVTNITYKNYYCLRCYEAGDDFRYWTVRIQRKSIPFRFSENELEKLSDHISYIYSKKENSVMASYCGGIGYFPVDTSLEIPPEIKNLLHVCEPGVISDCSEEWTDDEMRKKCRSYMAIKEVETLGSSPIKYKNIHCALCNYENLNSISCRKSKSGGAGFGGGASGYGASSGGSGEEFSLKSVFNINPSTVSNTDQSDNSQKCSSDSQECSDDKKKCSDGEQWNPYSKKCKKLTCLVPGAKIVNGTCVNA